MDLPGGLGKWLDMKHAFLASMPLTTMRVIHRPTLASAAAKAAKFHSGVQRPNVRSAALSFGKWDVHLKRQSERIESSGLKCSVFVKRDTIFPSQLTAIIPPIRNGCVT
jgi:hypothetical protein